MTDNVAIISVDGHVKPPRSVYRTYVDPPFREELDDVLRASEGTPDGFVHPGVGEQAQWDAARRLADLETQAVVAEILFTNGLPFAEPGADRSGDRARNRASNMAYNRWLSDFCSERPTRLFGLAAVSFDDVDQAVADVRWAKEHGFVGIQMPPLHPGSRYFFDPDLDPIWAACQQTGLVLCQHGGTGAPNYSPRSFASFMVLATEHWFFSGRSLWQLILGGVFDRFPGLQFALMETEQWWIGPILDLLDARERSGDGWSDFAETLGRLKPYRRLPSEYWADHCWAGLSPFSADQLSRRESTGFAISTSAAMVGLDYPHPETLFPGTLQEVKRLAGDPNLDHDAVCDVLYRNAAQLFGIDLVALAPDIERVGVRLDALPDEATPGPRVGSLAEVFGMTVERRG